MSKLLSPGDTASGLEAVSDTELSSERLSILKLDELLEVFECEIELLVQE